MTTCHGASTDHSRCIKVLERGTLGILFAYDAIFTPVFNSGGCVAPRLPMYSNRPVCARAFFSSLIQATDKWSVEKDIAAYIKKEFDSRHGPTWHCIVGRNFGSYVTHETRHFIYFYVDQLAILLFKSG